MLALLLGVGAARAQDGADALARGEELLQRREFAAAEAALRQATAADPGSTSARVSLALALLYQRKVGEAVEEGRTAVAGDPESVEARQVYGRALAAAGRPLEAARELELVLVAKPDDPVPLEALARAYAVAQDDRALAAHEKLVELKPEIPQSHLRLAEYLWATGETERGNQVAADALGAFPEQGQLHAVYGRALFSQDRVVDAARQLSLAREGGVLDLRTLSLLCYAQWRAGDVEAAAEAFATTLAQHPQSAHLHQDHGRFLLGIGRPEEALVALEEAVRLRPGHASTYTELGRALEGVGRIEEAEQAYRKAIELGPQLTTPHYALGRLLTLHGDREEGQRELALYRTIYGRVAEQQQEARRRAGEVALAWAELRRGEAEAALGVFASLPESVETMSGQATALSRLGRHEAAIVVLERALELAPENPRLRVQLASERVRAEEEP